MKPVSGTTSSLEINILVYWSRAVMLIHVVLLAYSPILKPYDIASARYIKETYALLERLLHNQYDWTSPTRPSSVPHSVFA